MQRSIPQRSCHSSVIALAALAIVAVPAAGVVAPIGWELVTTASMEPVGIVHAGDGSGRLFIVERPGVIEILDGGQLLPTPFLDITGRVGDNGSEQGLLGLAFHPDYADNGFFYVDYTNNQGDTVIARFSVSADPDVADPGSELMLLGVDQPFSNHNGGQLAFGPDGYLYIALGDGGSADDPFDNGQSLDTLLGKILRIDINADDFPGDPQRNYAIPSDNPFTGDPNALDEIWAYGLRNPWRFSFDRATGDLFIGDVGQNRIEEIDLDPAGSPGGVNYGWNRMEGSDCFEPPVDCNDGSLTLPILEYTHAEGGCSVSGGYRYRGTRNPLLDGTYLYGDYCTGNIWAARDAGEGWRATEPKDSPFLITSFGEDQAGEIYLARQSPREIYRLFDTRPFCDVEMSQDRYTDGDTVAVEVLRLVNRGAAPVGARLRISAILPNGDAVTLRQLGRVLLPADSDRDFGPHNLFTIGPDFPRGTYAIRCRLGESGMDGRPLAQDRDAFTIE